MAARMRELPRFPGKLRVAKALLGNLEGPGTEEALRLQTGGRFKMRSSLVMLNSSQA